MRNTARINAELKLLQRVYGDDRIEWAPDGSWIKIAAVPLPRGLNKAASNMLIIIPDQYGYGVPLRELYVDPELRIRDGGRWVEIPHYFAGYAPTETALAKNWRYLCLHALRWERGDSVVTFLNQVFTYLSDPFRWG